MDPDQQQQTAARPQFTRAESTPSLQSKAAQNATPRERRKLKRSATIGLMNWSARESVPDMQVQFGPGGRRHKITVAQAPLAELFDEQIPTVSDFSTFGEVQGFFNQMARRILKSLKRALLRPSTYVKALSLGGIVTAVAYRPNSILATVEHYLRSLPLLRDSPSLYAKAALSLTTGVAALGIGNVISTFTLRALLSWKGYMYNHPLTKIWAVCVKVACGIDALVTRVPTLYYQSSLPHLPVPRLEDTVRKYLKSVTPLLSRDDYTRIEAAAKHFLAHEGPKLQFYLNLRSWITLNWLEEWWEKYVYLKGRAPIMINSNFYTFDSDYSIIHKFSQLDRTASLIYWIIQYRILVDQEAIAPLLAGPAPLDMSGFERLFGTTRIPGREMDQLTYRKTDQSRHVVVFKNGIYYAFPVYDDRRRALPLHEIYRQIKFIMSDAAQGPDRPEEARIAALTAGSRTPWAIVRETDFASGINKQSLELIESAAFLLYIDDETPPDVDSKARALMHGSASNRWFDKSFCVITFPDGTAGFNVEHSYADATIAGHFVEWILLHESGHCKKEKSLIPANVDELPVRSSVPLPARLLWDLPKTSVDTIDASFKEARALIDDLDHHILIFEHFGKGFSKTCKMGPDGFIQAALQLAYFRDAGHFCQTYESGTARLFRNGRTETIRSCSESMTHWVYAMEEEGDDEDARQNRVKLLRKATDDHVAYTKMAMSGQGIDRHLFGLYVVSVGIGMDPQPQFLVEALSQSWTLSTSQTPTNQTGEWNASKDPGAKTIGGGFGPVSADGYGVSYIISGEDRINFHISSKKACPKTDSKRFGDLIEAALLDMRDIFSGAKKDGAAPGSPKKEAKQ
eukprot:comp16869_c0_seq3/m.27536 comp16869_c0_seq3/g.27536  ORF comp16869_c0_seq3/g.27536 comp16869_c0_seq3/m.27536 type:complete len:855 (+) comp16869_c0_seq3:60-2624(+)